MRQLATSGSPYEPQLGFSRGVRDGHIIAISGTAPLGADGTTVGPGDPAAQARRCFEIIELFKNIRPACTVVQVGRFIDPSWLVEIEADAVVPAIPSEGETS
jgi:enamine deaminase RidA (YjgF/YER057c/UK114 family)